MAKLLLLKELVYITINEAGKIQQVRSYWDETTMMAKLR